MREVTRRCAQALLVGLFAVLWGCGVAGGQEVASQNRLTMQVQVQYVHVMEQDLAFERTFSRFADFPATSDLFDVEQELVEEINEQLTQEVFNASLGNW